MAELYNNLFVRLLTKTFLIKETVIRVIIFFLYTNVLFLAVVLLRWESKLMLESFQKCSS